MIGFLWFLSGIIVGFVPVLAMFYMMRKKGSTNSFDSDQISELIGKIQHVTSVNVDTIERKITDLKMTVNQANSVFIKLNEAISDTANMMTKSSATPGVSAKFTEPSKNEGGVPEELPKEELDFTSQVGQRMNVKPLTREEKVLELDRKGWNSQRIAESLDMGVGEVELIIELASGFFGEEAQ